MATDKQSLSERDICTKFITPVPSGELIRFHSLCKVRKGGHRSTFKQMALRDTVRARTLASKILALCNEACVRNLKRRYIALHVKA
jgi:hypothetical protein